MEARRGTAKAEDREAKPEVIKDPLKLSLFFKEFSSFPFMFQSSQPVKRPFLLKYSEMHGACLSLSQMELRPVQDVKPVTVGKDQLDFSRGHFYLWTIFLFFWKYESPRS